MNIVMHSNYNKDVDVHTKTQSIYPIIPHENVYNRSIIISTFSLMIQVALDISIIFHK